MASPSPSDADEAALALRTPSDTEQLSSPLTAAADGIVEANPALSSGAADHIPILDDEVRVSSSSTSYNNAIKVCMWITMNAQ